jgi:hypothetical protein
MLSWRGSRSSGSAVTPSVGDQRERRDVTSTRQPPLGGRQASSSASSSQLSNTSSRGTALCHASFARCTPLLQRPCLQARRGACSHLQRDLVRAGEAEPEHAAREEAPDPVDQLDGQLRLAQPAEPRRGDHLAERYGRVAATERRRDLELLVTAPDEERIRRQRHARACRQLGCPCRQDVRRHGGEERLRCGESGGRSRRRTQLDERLVDREFELGRRADPDNGQPGVQQPAAHLAAGDE